VAMEILIATILTDVGRPADTITLYLSKPFTITNGGPAWIKEFT